MMNRKLHRPEPILHHTAKSVDRSVPPQAAAARLRDGEMLIVADLYTTGEAILARLDLLLRPPPHDAPFEARQAHRRRHREAVLRLLAPIEEHRLALADARPIGFLEELYPGRPTFVLPFAQVQELFGAWNRYREGVHLKVLGHSLFPFYGTYVPTRVSHLELFGTWLHQYKGPRDRAIDVGTGCGVLALMLCRAGFARVLATDINPNAVESVSRELDRLAPPPPIDLFCGDLLGDGPEPADLIVFNPPWIRGEAQGLLDEALVFTDGLFERFFDQACARLTATGRVVLVFSNILELVQPDVPHPILSELERGRLRLVQKLARRVEPAKTPDGGHRRTRERVEIWELARA
ncbi:methyltransferase [Myxococcota bacterium]|nr:methyltransferase [Myxococcota bacterium]